MVKTVADTATMRCSATPTVPVTVPRGEGGVVGATTAGVMSPVARRVTMGIMGALSAGSAADVGVSRRAKGCCGWCPPLKQVSQRS